MMPIIKKWLYSDKDIFLREIVANGVDAITKHKKLVDMGEATKDESGYKITVIRYLCYIVKSAKNRWRYVIYFTINNVYERLNVFFITCCAQNTQIFNTFTA